VLPKGIVSLMFVLGIALTPAFASENNPTLSWEIPVTRPEIERKFREFFVTANKGKLRLCLRKVCDKGNLKPPQEVLEKFNAQSERSDNEPIEIGYVITNADWMGDCECLYPKRALRKCSETFCRSAEVLSHTSETIESSSLNKPVIISDPKGYDCVCSAYKTKS